MKKAKESGILRIVLIILIIALIILVSFLGIYKSENGIFKKVLPEYLLSKDLSGSRLLELLPDETKTTTIKDSEGNVIESATDEEIAEKGYTKEETTPNNSEILTEENFIETKKIVEKRLKDYNYQDYTIKQDVDSGKIFLELIENDSTDNVISTLSQKGQFSIKDSETNEVLLDNSMVKDAKVLSGSTSSGNNIYLNIEFNKEGKSKLEEVSKNYIQTTDDNGNTTKKQIVMSLDDTTLVTTSFDEPITNGAIQLTVGSASTSTSELQKYVEQAKSTAAVINNGSMPIKYTTDINKYVKANINQDYVKVIFIVVIVIAILAIVYLIMKYKMQGLLFGISCVGLVATLMLIIRYTNVKISIEGIYAIVTISIVNYVINVILLKQTKENKNIKEVMKKILFMLIPLIIIAIVCTLASSLSVSSFGMVMFWGIVSIIIYNLILTKNLIINNKNEQ